MKRFSILLLAVITLASCKDSNPLGCGKNTFCTENFVSVLVTFTDKDGKGIPIKNYSAVNQRTGEPINTNGSIYTDLTPGTFIVIDDSETKKVSLEGDDIKVTGTYEITGQTKSAIIKVGRDECFCHVNKIFGPDKIVFD